MCKSILAGLQEIWVNGKYREIFLLIISLDCKPKQTARSSPGSYCKSPVCCLPMCLPAAATREISGFSFLIFQILQGPSFWQNLTQNPAGNGILKGLIQLLLPQMQKRVWKGWKEERKKSLE